MQAPGFWEDRKSNALMQRHAALEKIIKTFEHLERDAEDVAVLFELALEGKDDSARVEAE